jgi:hypothetical protein
MEKRHLGRLQQKFGEELVDRLRGGVAPYVAFSQP